MGNSQTQFSALVQAYSADLYRFAVWLCRDRLWAEDLVQEAYLRAWRGLSGLRSQESAKAWLITILRREYSRQRGQRHQEVALDDGDLPQPVADVDADTITLRQAVLRLTEDYREPLLLQVIGGFSAEEIGQIMNLSTANVLTRLFRARQKLRAELVRRSGVNASQGKNA